MEPNENNISFKKSNLFFRNKNDELLFINKVDNSKFYYDAKNLKNVLHARNEIFNVPFKLIVKNDKFEKKFYKKVQKGFLKIASKNKNKYEIIDSNQNIKENETKIKDILSKLI